MRDDPPLMTKRILQLRQFGMFGHADLEELAVIAENCVDRTFDAGELVAGADSLEALHFVVTGGLAYGASQIGPRQVHGALELAAGRRGRMPTFAGAGTRTLELSASEYFEILEDNFGLLRGIIRDLAALVIPLRVEPRPVPALPHGTFGFVERMIVLRHALPFAAGRLEAIAILAHAAAEKRWPTGALVHHPDAALIVLEGSLCCDGRPVGVGHAFGAVEALAGVVQHAVLESVTPVRTLEIPTAAILDVLEDHTDFALAIMQTLARTVLAEESRVN